MPPSFRGDFPPQLTSNPSPAYPEANLIGITPHRHAWRCASRVVPDPLKLTANTKNHRWAQEEYKVALVFWNLSPFYREMRPSGGEQQHHESQDLTLDQQIKGKHWNGRLPLFVLLL